MANGIANKNSVCNAVIVCCVCVYAVILQMANKLVKTFV